MKKSKRILAVVLSLLMAFSVTPITVISAASEAVNENVSADELVNLYDPSTAFAGYVTAQNVEKESSSHYTSDYIDVTAGDVIYFGPCNSAQDFQLHGYNAEKNKIVDSTVGSSKLMQVDTFGKYVIYAYTVPTGVYAVRLANAAAVNSVYTITVNQKFDTNVFDEYWTSTEELNAVYSKFGAYLGLKTDGVLYQKSALFVGDSICAATQDNSLWYSGWAGRIGEINVMDYVNGGVSGASCSTTRPAKRIVSQLLKNAEREFDYVVLHGGVNDAWDSEEVGVISSGYDLKDFDTNTFAGGLEEMIFHALKCYPNAKIGYIMNFAAPNCTKGTVGNMDAYFAVAKQICEKWGIPYLNLYENDEFCQNVLKVTTTEFLPDNIHPNARGYDLLYPVIEEWMEGLTAVAQNKAGTSVIEIGNEDELRNISKMLTADYVLKNDIKLTKAWTPISIFEGSLDGNGYAISGISIVNAAKTNWGTSGFFAQTLNAKITNLTLEGTLTNNISGVAVELGAFVGNPRGTVIENCTSQIDISTGTDSARVWAGGIAGLAQDGTIIKNCTNRGTIYIRNQSSAAYCYIGGICGQSNTSVTFDGCTNIGDIDACLKCGDYAYVGGILGYADYGVNGKTLFTNCTNAGTILAHGIAGGILGFSKQYELIISDCKNTADITCTNVSSGILATAQTGSTYKDIVIKNCAVYGTKNKITIKATAANSHAAGIFAYLNAKNVGFDISGCMNAATISAGQYAGGIVARANNAATRPIAISYCSNFGSVEASNSTVFLGGILGRNQGKEAVSYVNYCYNAGIISAPNNTSGFAGAIAGSEGKSNYDNNFSTISPMFGYGKSVASQSNTRVLTNEDDLQSVVEALNNGKKNDVNGFRYSKNAIEPVYSLTNVPTTFIGTEVSSINDGRYAVRFLAVLESVDYEEAGFLISAKIKIDDKITNIENKKYDISVVCKKLEENSEYGFDELSAPIGTYFMGLRIYNIPIEATVEFTVIPYTVSEGITTNGISYTVTYANGSVIQ